MKVNAQEESFELMELFGKTVLFINMRVDRSTVPENLYVYELRDEDCTGEICEIKPFIMVNHWGTIICKEPFEMDEYWHSKFVDEGDYCYLGDTAKLDEYINTDCYEEESQSEGMEMS